MSAPVAKTGLQLAGEEMYEAQDGPRVSSGLEAWLPDHMLLHRWGRLRHVKHQPRRAKKLTASERAELERLDREINEGIERIWKRIGEMR